MVPSAGQVELKPDHLPTVICLSSPEVDSCYTSILHHLAICLSAYLWSLYLTLPNLEGKNTAEMCDGSCAIECSKAHPSGFAKWSQTWRHAKVARRTRPYHVAVFFGALPIVFVCAKVRGIWVVLLLSPTLSLSLSSLSLSLWIRSEGKHHVTSLSVTWS